MREVIYQGRDGCPLHAAVIDTLLGAPTGLPLLLLHGGGPDHRSLIPLAQRLSLSRMVILPDIRGYGRSICRNTASHTWSRYVDDAIRLLGTLSLERAIVGGAGMGGTVALRLALEHPERVAAAIVMSVEDIEDDAAKAAETAFMDAFARRVRAQGLEAAWSPILADLAPVIGSMVRDALPRSDPESSAAAAAIGRDRAFRSLSDLDGLVMPVLVFPGLDARHPPALARELAARLVHGQLAKASMSQTMLTAEDFAQAFAPDILAFINSPAIDP